MNTKKLLTELEDLGFPMLADCISEKEIDLAGSLKHLESNKCMMDNEEDEKAFQRAEVIARKMF
jgi:hypothetical protein